MAKIPSIALIPSGYKATKIYSVLPVDGGGDFTFDRGTATSVQTRVNKDGLIENVDQDVPRLDYLDGGCPSLLLEPASTNLYDYSEDLALYGSRVGLDLEADSSLSPDGSLNADLLTEDTSTGSHVLRKTAGPTTTAGLDYSFSFFVKANGRNIVALSNNAGTASVTAFFNLTSGTILSSTFDSASMVDYGNGWWRIETTHEATGTGDYEARIYTSIADGSFTHTGDGVSGLYIWGLQVEQQSYATSYVRSLGSQGVRDAETCNGAGTTAEINSQEGVLFFEGRAIGYRGSSELLELNDSTTNNRVSFFYTTPENEVRINVYNGSNNIITHNYINTLDNIKIALLYQQDNIRFYINGLLIGVIDSFTTFSSGTLNNLDFHLSGGSLPFYGRVKKLSVYDQALSTTELETLTGFTSFAEMQSYLSYS